MKLIRKQSVLMPTGKSELQRAGLEADIINIDEDEQANKVSLKQHFTCSCS